MYDLQVRHDDSSVCFFVFDRDKSGCIEQGEVKILMNVLWNVVPPDNVSGNTRTAWKKLPFDIDSRVEFEEFSYFHKQYPKLFSPSFRLQMNIHGCVMSESWWTAKRFELVDDAELKIKQMNEKMRKEARKKNKQNEKKRRVKMGCAKYYCCMLIELLSIMDVGVEIDEANEQERKRLRELALKKAREMAEMQMKNPETLEWKTYCIKKETKAAAIVDPEIEVETKEVKHQTVRDRSSRKALRQQRKLDRELDWLKSNEL